MARRRHARALNPQPSTLNPEPLMPWVRRLDAALASSWFVGRQLGRAQRLHHSSRALFVCGGEAARGGASASAVCGLPAELGCRWPEVPNAPRGSWDAAGQCDHVLMWGEVTRDWDPNNLWCGKQTGQARTEKKNGIMLGCHRSCRLPPPLQDAPRSPCKIPPLQDAPRSPRPETFLSASRLLALIPKA